MSSSSPLSGLKQFTRPRYLFGLSGSRTFFHALPIYSGSLCMNVNILGLPKRNMPLGGACHQTKCIRVVWKQEIYDGWIDEILSCQVGFLSHAGFNAGVLGPSRQGIFK